MDAHPTCPPATINFKNLFLVQEEEDEETASLADVLAILAAKWPNATLFGAADLATLANNNGEFSNERERAMTVREFLFPGIPATQTVTSKAAGKRLKRHVDEPVPHDPCLVPSWGDNSDHPSRSPEFRVIEPEDGLRNTAHTANTASAFPSQENAQTSAVLARLNAIAGVASVIWQNSNDICMRLLAEGSAAQHH